MPEEQQSFGTLVHYRIDRLFGNRNIEFSPAHGGPTLLTGANGTGKSTILRTINAFGSGLWLDLLPIPFRSVTLEFDSGVSLRAIKDAERPDEVIYIESPFGSWTLDRRALAPLDLDESHQARRTPGGWEIDGRIYNAFDARRILSLRELAANEDASWIAEISRRFSVLYVPDQRLAPPGQAPAPRSRQLQAPFQNAPAGVATAEQFARDLYRLIQEGLSSYAARSETLDRDFPRRVVEAMSEPIDIPRETLEDLLQEIESERGELERAGLLEKEEERVTFDRDRLDDPKVAPVIKVYAEDTLAKFAVLARLKTQLQAFSGFVNSHYRDKRLVINKGYGFVILPIGDPDRRRDVVDILPARLLSSGEQQVLVLSYQILFRAEPRTLILIDEPELSLHVSWLSSLIDDFSTMGAIQDVQFIMATHSPTLVGDREELRISLDPDSKRTRAVELLAL